MDRDQNGNPIRILEFIKVVLLLWDRYDNDVKVRTALRRLVHSFYLRNVSEFSYEDLYDLCEYVGVNMRYHTRKSKHTEPDALKGRAMYEHEIQRHFGKAATEITDLDQWLFTDVGYYLYDLGWIGLDVMQSLDTVLRAFEKEVSGERIVALTELKERVSKRLKLLSDDEKWNKKHNTMDPDHWDAMDDAYLRFFYIKIILPQYVEVDADDIDWHDVHHVKVGENSFANYFRSRGRAYILVTALDDKKSEFTPSPMYQLIKSQGQESLEIRGGKGTPAIPRLIGTYRLYAERLASSFPEFAAEQSEAQ